MVTRLAVLLLASAGAGACSADARTPSSRGDSGSAAGRPAGRTAPVPGPSATPVQSPDSFRVRIETSKGPFTVRVVRALAPRGADRFYELVTVGYFTDVRFFRMVPGFVVQFGIHGDPQVNRAWAQALLPDEPMRLSNTRGTIAFTIDDERTDSRSVQLFVNTADNARKLDRYRTFAPIGMVTEGMDVIDRLNAEYGEDPVQSRIVTRGNVYLQRWFPALDYITAATVLPPSVP